MEFPYSVGETPIVEYKINGRNVRVKDESWNAFGTHKDRKMEAFLKNIESRLDAHDIDAIAILSGGNAAWSLKNMLLGTGVAVRALMEHDDVERVGDSLRKIDVEVFGADLSKKLSSSEIVEAVRLSPSERIVDASPGHPEYYAKLAREVWKEANTVVCPVGTGELFAGLYAKATSGQKIIGVTARSVRTIADKLPGPHRPYDDVLKKAMFDGHELHELSEKQIDRAMDLVPEDLMAEPSAAVVFGILDRISRALLKTTVFINTGQGVPMKS